MPVTTSYGCCSFLTATFKGFNIKSTPNLQASNKKNSKRDKQGVREAQIYFTQNMTKPYLQQPDRERKLILEATPSSALPIIKPISQPVPRQRSLPPTSSKSKQSRNLKVYRTVSSSSSLGDINKNELFSSYALIEQAISKHSPSLNSLSKNVNVNQEQKKSSVPESYRYKYNNLPVPEQRDSISTRKQDQILKNRKCKRLIHDHVDELSADNHKYGKHFYFNPIVLSG